MTGVQTCALPISNCSVVVFLGAYVAKKPDVIDEETIIEAIRVELGEKKARFLEGNIKALKAGMEYVRNLG